MSQTLNISREEVLLNLEKIEQRGKEKYLNLLIEEKRMSR